MSFCGCGGAGGAARLIVAIDQYRAQPDVAAGSDRIEAVAQTFDLAGIFDHHVGAIA